jgi:hypothetical protein
MRHLTGCCKAVHRDGVVKADNGGILRRRRLIYMLMLVLRVYSVKSC